MDTACKLGNSFSEWGAIVAPTKSWHIVGLLAIPCGSTTHSYLWSGSSWLQDGTVKAKRLLSLGQRGMEKKQSFISIVMMGHWLGRVDKRGKPCWTGPIICICRLIALRSCRSLHFPDFFLITKIGVFHGEMEDFICPGTSCSLINSFAAVSFSEESSHWGTHTGSSEFHVIGIASSVAPRKNPAPAYPFS